MGNSLKCIECEKEKKEYTYHFLRRTQTEIYVYPTKICGITYIPKNNTQTNYYLCSNGHQLIKKEKCY